ncbi:hypothetical protein GALMADRAFT_412333 [Galerina marginata CBS 339.88]|uniref:Uncharacterized protein n=1 Tax=Galerina marginata (strain CBS 339.88) TaxID=685588 RepID=A0A067TFI5_GALM3|nr:hypothetical protein GALMADRAFT_412333 [Galerina marginata CBS 339.88]
MELFRSYRIQTSSLEPKSRASGVMSDQARCWRYLSLLSSSRPLHLIFSIPRMFPRKFLKLLPLLCFLVLYHSRQLLLLAC